jgi:hypothetical protein
MGSVERMKALGSLLVILLLTGCGEPEDDGPTPLDPAATRACATFERLVVDYDTLAEEEIRTLTLEMWKDAQVSQTTGIRTTARDLVRVVFEELPSRFDYAVKNSREACAGRASPQPVIE